VIAELNYEDREIVMQVLREGRQHFTDRQFDCLLMCMVGMKQEDVATALGIDQTTVSRHFNWALDKVEELAQRYT
jgi:DNA-binding CsgD family transcriptional regulator